MAGKYKELAEVLKQAFDPGIIIIMYLDFLQTRGFLYE